VTVASWEQKQYNMFQSQKAYKLRPEVWKKFRQTPFMYDSQLKNKFIRPKMKLIKEN